MTKPTLPQTNPSQAVRLPKDVAFPKGAHEAVIRHNGPIRIIAPANATWDDFFNAPGIDLGPREQPALSLVGRITPAKPGAIRHLSSPRHQNEN